MHFQSLTGDSCPDVLPIFTLRISILTKGIPSLLNNIRAQDAVTQPTSRFIDHVLSPPAFHHDLLFGALFVLFPHITLKCQPSQISIRITYYSSAVLLCDFFTCIIIYACFILRHSCHPNFYTNHLSNPFKILLFSVVRCMSLHVNMCM